MSLTNFAENLIIDHISGRTDIGALPDIFLGLSTTTPAEDSTNVTEPSGNAYARVDIATTAFAAAAAGTTDNDAAITWPEATGSWGTVTHVVAYSALTGGNLWWFAALTTSTAIGANDTFSIGAGDLDITID